MMSETPVVDSDVLRDQVREKYRAVAVEPKRDVSRPCRTATRRPARLRPAIVDALPDRTVESFAGVGNPFSLPSNSCTRVPRDAQRQRPPPLCGKGL